MMAVRAADRLAALDMSIVLASTWLMVFARGRIVAAPCPLGPPELAFAAEFLRTLPEAGPVVLLVLSLLPPRGLEEAAAVM